MKIKIIIPFVLFIIVLTNGCKKNNFSVECITSNPQAFWKPLDANTDIEPGISETAVTISPDKKLQVVDDFGGCFNELGWEALQHVSGSSRENIFRQLFDTISGCRFNICRMPIGANDYAVDWYSFDEIKDDFGMEHYFRNGANAYMYWNMVLDETGKSQWGWKQNSMISIDKKTGGITFNPEFYLMKHFSHFINPGARMIETSEKNCLAFENAGSVIVIFYNGKNAGEKFININNHTFSVVLSEKSFSTFKIKI